MNAIHWLRARQEESELTYWFSLVGYKHRDRSFVNRIYFLYLVLFFSAWIFATLTFFASGGAILLRLLNPGDPVRAAVLLEVLLLGSWCIFTLWQVLQHSPVVFSEQDAALVCQTPIKRRHVTARWFLMPWLKSAVPFWLAAITLGFSAAETTLPGRMGIDRIVEYVGYGLRAWLVIIPVHMALFALVWAVGIYRLQKNLERHWLAWPVILAAVALFAFLLGFALDTSISSMMPWSTIAEAVLYPLRAGFEAGGIGAALPAGGLFAAAMFGVMVWVSGTFSLSRAAEETREVESLNSALRYGLTAYAENLQTQQRLGVRSAPFRLPAFAGAGILLWKDILQSQRSFRLASLFVWFRIALIMLGFLLLPDPGSRVFALAIWVVQIGQVSVVRMRNDLSRWSLVRQLPIPSKKFLLFELVAVYLLAVAASLAGLAVHALIFGAPLDELAVLVPGMVAGVAGMANFDIIRRSRPHLLLSGSAPEIGVTGLLLGLGIAALPLLAHSLLPGILGLALGTLLGVGLGAAAFRRAAGAYRKMTLRE